MHDEKKTSTFFVLFFFRKVYSSSKRRLLSQTMYPCSSVATVDTDDAACASGFQVEAGVFEVETDLCSWGTFQQPLLANVSAGTPLRIIAGHLPLWAPEPAEGVLRLQVGDQPIWELTVPIPLGAMLYDEEIPAPVDLYADDPVTLHIHNHGTNSWRFAVFHALEEG